MKKKRILSGMLAAMLLGIPPVLAADDMVISRTDIKGKNVIVSGIISSPGARIYLEVVRQNAEIKDTDNIYAAKQVTAGADGSFSMEYEMPEEDRAEKGKPIDGYFTIYAISAGYEKKSIDFSYISEASRKSFFEGLNNAMNTSAGFKSFMADEKYKVMLDTYGVLSEEFNKLTDEIKDKAYEIIKKTGITFDKENISEINEAVITMRLNGLKNTDSVKEVLNDSDIISRCELKFGDITYDNADEATQNWFCEMVLAISEKNGFGAVNELNDMFSESIALKEVNEAHYSDLYLLLEDNKEILKIDSSQSFISVSNLSGEADKTNVMKYLKELSGSIKSIGELKDLLDRAFSKYNESPDNNKNNNQQGSGRRPSSSKSGAAITGSVPVADNNLNKDNNKEDNNKEYFDDLEGYDWAKEAINNLAAKGIISGDGNGKFAPGRNVTRAEFLTMLLSAVDLAEDDASCSFDDVAPDDWCYKYIASAYKNGITSGVDEKSFGKNNFITRQEAAVFIHRAAVRTYIPLENNPSEEFSDNDKIASWAKRSVKIMHEAGLINGMGDNCFEPLGSTTRAQAAKMIYALYEMI